MHRCKNFVATEYKNEIEQLDITPLLAIYGSALSTAVFIWNILRATPRIKVDLIFGIEEVGGEVVSGAHISIKNPSGSTVHIGNVSILYPYRNVRLVDYISHVVRFKRLPRTVGWVHSALSNFGIDDGCPMALEPGKSHGILVPEKILDQIFEDSTERKIRAVAQDQLWRDKYSSPMEYPNSGGNA
jgi:hypothetical protein